MNDAQFKAFLREIEENDLVEAPKNLKEKILIETNAFHTQALYHTKVYSKRIQLFFYSMKICVAVACAIVLLILPGHVGISINSNQGTEKRQEMMQKSESIKTRINEKTNKISSNLKNLSTELLNIGGRIYD